jgi:hypothetical protein
MLRVLLTIVLPLLLPTAIYAAWVVMLQWSARGEPLRWTTLPWIWLSIAGVLLLGVVLAVVTVHFGESDGGTYVPPRYEDGRVVPSHIEPRRAP